MQKSDKSHKNIESDRQENKSFPKPEQYIRMKRMAEIDDSLLIVNQKMSLNIQFSSPVLESFDFLEQYQKYKLRAVLSSFDISIDSFEEHYNYVQNQALEKYKKFTIKTMGIIYELINLPHLLKIEEMKMQRNIYEKFSNAIICSEDQNSFNAFRSLNKKSKLDPYGFKSSKMDTQKQKVYQLLNECNMLLGNRFETQIQQNKAQIIDITNEINKKSKQMMDRMLDCKVQKPYRAHNSKGNIINTTRLLSSYLSQLRPNYFLSNNDYLQKSHFKIRSATEMFYVQDMKLYAEINNAYASELVLSYFQSQSRSENFKNIDFIGISLINMDKVRKPNENDINFQRNWMNRRHPISAVSSQMDQKSHGNKLSFNSAIKVKHFIDKENKQMIASLSENFIDTNRKYLDIFGNQEPKTDKDNLYEKELNYEFDVKCNPFTFQSDTRKPNYFNKQTFKLSNRISISDLSLKLSSHQQHFKNFFPGIEKRCKKSDMKAQAKLQTNLVSDDKSHPDFWRDFIEELEDQAKQSETLNYDLNDDLVAYCALKRQYKFKTEASNQIQKLKNTKISFQGDESLIQKQNFSQQETQYERINGKDEARRRLEEKSTNMKILSQFEQKSYEKFCLLSMNQKTKKGALDMMTSVKETSIFRYGLEMNQNLDGVSISSRGICNQINERFHFLDEEMHNSYNKFFFYYFKERYYLQNSSVKESSDIPIFMSTDSKSDFMSAKTIKKIVSLMKKFSFFILWGHDVILYDEKKQFKRKIGTFSVYSFTEKQMAEKLLYQIRKRKSALDSQEWQYVFEQKIDSQFQRVQRMVVSQISKNRKEAEHIGYRKTIEELYVRIELVHRNIYNSHKEPENVFIRLKKGKKLFREIAGNLKGEIINKN